MTVTAMPAHNNRARQPEDTVMEGSSSGMRAASARDAAACREIYRPYVLTTAISWEIDVPTVAEMAARIDSSAPPTSGSSSSDMLRSLALRMARH
jgi:hypothetical protein